MGQQQSFFPDEGTHLTQAEKFLPAFVDQYRRSALGSLVKGVVHNLNGLLQVLSLQLELLQKACQQEERVRTFLFPKVARCQEQLEKMRLQVEVLFQKGVRDEQEGPQPIQLNELLEENLALLHHDLFFKHRVKVRKEFAPQLRPVHGSYIDFSQAFWNLLQNALEAMEESCWKELTVATGERRGWLQVSIRDTGCGIPEGIRPLLFQPFVTSKEGHYGLGLFFSRLLLGRYGATFRVSSREGGTVLSVRLP